MTAPDVSLTSAPAAPTPPIRLGAPQQFATLRDYLLSAQYTEPEICRRLGIASIYEYRPGSQGRAADPDLRDPLDVLIRLLLHGEAVGSDAVRAHVPADALGAMRELGLLVPGSESDETCAASVLLYPTESLFIISDLMSGGGDRPSVPAVDAVYPAITRNTQTFLAALPATPCDSFLELCSGTGIAALVATRYARRTWAADITERATRYAHFNALLNDIDNVEAVQGDLYDAVTGLTFDRIVAHPPYVAAVEQQFIFRDGGPDGEQITARIIAGIPEHLRPGGRFYCSCVATDRTSAPLQQRVRAMLGAREREFDVLVVAREAFSPSEYYYRLAAAGRGNFADAEWWHGHYRKLGVERLVYAWIVVQRHVGDRAAFTVRRPGGPRTGSREVEWLLDWESRATDPATRGRLLEARPSLSPFARLRAVQRAVNGEWVAEASSLTTDAPFPATADCTADVAAFLAKCDGTRTARDHLRSLRGQGVVPPDMDEDQFAQMLQALVGSGFLTLDEAGNEAGAGADG
jgi:SAM-dependent methyltransferase